MLDNYNFDNGLIFLDGANLSFTGYYPSSYSQSPILAHQHQDGLVSANLEGATWENINFDDHFLRGVNFSGSRLTDVSFINSDLRDANFSGAKIHASYGSNIDFTGADLSGADLCGADLSGTSLDAATFGVGTEATLYNAYTRFPEYFNPVSAGLRSVPIDLNASVALEMIWVEPGTFTMGSPTSEAGRSTNETQHEVTLTQGFYLGKYEVTQAQYEAVMTGNTYSLNATPSTWPNNPDRPVENVSWDDIQKFLTLLNTQQAGNIPEGWAYVLPTEAQWEYACRAGTTTAYSWGDAITSNDANYNSHIGQTVNFGQYSANPWGFFDMHGNVWEWTADAYASYATGAQTDPFNVGTSGSNRVYRGGSWNSGGTNLRSANRFYFIPSYRDDNIGFRVGFQQQ